MHDRPDKHKNIFNLLKINPSLLDSENLPPDVKLRFDSLNLSGMMTVVSHQSQIKNLKLVIGEMRLVPYLTESSE